MVSVVSQNNQYYHNAPMRNGEVVQCTQRDVDARSYSTRGTTICKRLHSSHTATRTTLKKISTSYAPGSVAAVNSE